MVILLVDDEPLFTDAVSRNLRNGPWEIITAASGDEALDLLADRADIEILATDFNMPGMDGAQLIHRARALRPDLYTVVLTGFAEREYAIRSLRVGADDFLDKESEVDAKLSRSFRKAMRQRAVARMGRELLRLDDKDEILEQVFRSLGAVDRFGGACLALRQRVGDACQVQRAMNLRTGESLAEGEMLGADSAYSYVIESKNVFFPPIFVPTGIDLRPLLEDSQSIIVVPLSVHGHETDALGVEHPEAAEFRIEDLKLLQQVKAWISVAVKQRTGLAL